MDKVQKKHFHRIFQIPPPPLRTYNYWDVTHIDERDDTGPVRLLYVPLYRGFGQIKIVRLDLAGVNQQPA
jgi:hypothetical protein